MKKLIIISTIITIIMSSCGTGRCTLGNQNLCPAYGNVDQSVEQI